MQRKKIGFISLGCDKNRVNTEKIIFGFKKNGFEIENDEKKSQIIIINTCGFICDAKRESIKTIIEIGKLKKQNLEKLVVCGCLVCDKDLEQLKEALGEVDAFVPASSEADLVSVVQGLYEKTQVSKAKFEKNRVLTTPKHYAYLKIADGCNNFCTYCKIPYIKGRFKSEKIGNILKEAKALAKEGVREIILVAQDTTRFGSDGKNRKNLVYLLKKLEKITKIEKIRLLYCYPDCISDELINYIAKSKKVCHYLDIPLQHISDNVLKNMNRKTTKAQIESLISKLRAKIPDISIRTTFIVGFPGETEKDFAELLAFIKKFKLNNVGFFKYSKEDGTPAARMKGQILAKIKKNRLKIASETQFLVVSKLLNAKINKIVSVRADYVSPLGTHCHSDFFAPGIDGEIIIAGENLEIGKNYTVKITKKNGYDLIAKLV